MKKKPTVPVTLGGYCIVSLREQQDWQQGQVDNQLLFDGQLYWFASPREQAMFSANPLRYVPALGGHCVVTFADQGERAQGEARFGIKHDQRLFFFSSHVALKKFKTRPVYYGRADLANEGRCLVSQVDESQQLPGLPETTVIVDGLRYLFAGLHQQQKFLVNAAHYGVIPTVRVDGEMVAAQQGMAENTQESEGTASSESADKPRSIQLRNKAMSGYCPVSIREKQVWVEGKEQFSEDFDGQTYLLAGRAEQKLFQKNPNTYIPAFGGYCVVTELDGKRHVQGSIYYAALHEGEDRFYLFAGAEHMKKFDANPQKYINVDLAGRGLCVVSKLDEGLGVVGLPELLTWHEGKRYLFANSEKQAQFKANPAKYEERELVPIH